MALGGAMAFKEGIVAATNDVDDGIADANDVVACVCHEVPIFPMPRTICSNRGVASLRNEIGPAITDAAVASGRPRPNRAATALQSLPRVCWKDEQISLRDQRVGRPWQDARTTTRGIAGQSHLFV